MQKILDPLEHTNSDEAKETRIARRELLKLAPLAAFGAFAVPGLQSRLLERGREFMSTAQRAIGPMRLAPTFTAADLTPLKQFPVNAYLTDDPGVDPAEWRLKIHGAVARPTEFTLAQLRALPRFTQITRHICIEGWTVIGSFTGVRLSEVLRHVGAASDARLVEFECADDYYESLDLPAAVHPQTMLCYEMYGEPLTPAHGAPLRLQMPIKLGYKQAKHVVEMRVARVQTARRGYWVDQGYPAYGGI
jgi:DMSO/TMAO reductase YedYZ molybdopterin-dependent catalytic subunit